MPRRKPYVCRICQRHESEVGRISWPGRCVECADRRMLENAEQMREHSGPWFQHWRARCAAGFGAVLVDEQTDDD